MVFRAPMVADQRHGLDARSEYGRAGRGGNSTKYFGWWPEEPAPVAVIEVDISDFPEEPKKLFRCYKMARISVFGVCLFVAVIFAILCVLESTGANARPHAIPENAYVYHEDENQICYMEMRKGGCGP
ncbi:unnamed protein product, partial [Mesorhabditis spiculigera]